MALTLTIADNADNSGATATVAGSNPSATNVVWTQPFSGALGTATLTNSGNRTGDGAVSLSLAAGHYVAYCASTLAGATTVTAICYLAVTTGQESVEYQLLTGTQIRVRSATLAGVNDDSIVVRKLPLDRDVGSGLGVALPAIVISPLAAQALPTGTNLRDDYRYGILVSMFFADNKEPTFADGMAAYLRCREQIQRAFNNQRIAIVASGVDVFTCTVEPGDAILPQAWRENYLAGALTLRFTAREPRGI